MSKNDFLDEMDLPALTVGRTYSRCRGEGKSCRRLFAPAAVGILGNTLYLSIKKR